MERGGALGRSAGGARTVVVGALGGVSLILSGCLLDLSTRRSCRGSSDCLDGYCCTAGECQVGACARADAGAVDGGEPGSCAHVCSCGGECNGNEICDLAGHCVVSCDPLSCAEQRQVCYIACDRSADFNQCVASEVNITWCGNTYRSGEGDPDGPFIAEVFPGGGPTAELGCEALLRYDLLVNTPADMTAVTDVSFEIYDDRGLDVPLHRDAEEQPVIDYCFPQRW